jgi:hypothetical protein
MIHLYVTLRDRAVGHFEIPGDRVRIGRHPDNEVQIDSMAVSRHHCVLERLPQGGWTVEDLGSNNGTYVNGARITQRTMVRENDALGIGKFAVSFRTSVDATAPSERMLGVSQELREHGAAMKGFFILLNRPGAPVPLERDAFVIGADASCDLQAAGAGKLAVVVRGFGGFQIIDVSPTMDRVRVGTTAVADRAWLKDGDAVFVGDLELEFHLGAPNEGQATMAMQAPVGGFKPPSGFAP